MYSIKNRCKACGAMDAWSHLFDEQIGEITAKESNCGGSDVEAQFQDEGGTFHVIISIEINLKSQNFTVRTLPTENNFELNFGFAT